MTTECGHYYWIRLHGDASLARIWEPAYRYRGARGVDVWLVIATNEEVLDHQVAEVGPRLEPPR